MVLESNAAARSALKLVSRDGGDLYLPSTGIARFTRSGSIESGQFMDMGTGPVMAIDNLTYRTRQRIRVTLR